MYIFFILQQSSMQGTNKFVSILDLKMLGAKFIVIQDSNDHINRTLCEIRKSKFQDFTQIQKPSFYHEETTLNFSNTNPVSRLKEIQALPQTFKKSTLVNDKDIQSLHRQSSKQLQKYKSFINRIKKNNQILQKEIVNLYKQKRICDHQQKTKPVRAIYQAGQQIMKKETLFKINSESSKYSKVYENLNADSNPYKEECLTLQKKFANNNLHKNFEHFLQAHHKRIPEFIKNMR